MNSWKKIFVSPNINWKVVKLGEVGEFKNGVNKNKEAFGKGTLFVNIGDAYLPKLDCSKLNRVDVTSIEKSVYELKYGDIIFVRSSVKPSGVGYTTVFLECTEPVVYSGFMIRFRFGNKEEFSPKFYNYLFRSEFFRKAVISASTVSANTNVNQDNLKEIIIPKIPLPQQTKIAHILTTLDNVIEKTAAAIAKYEAIKQGMMHDLFTRGIGADGQLRPTYADAPELYKESALGWIPREWEDLTLSNISKINQGLQIAISSRYDKPDRNRYLYITIQYLNNLADENYTFYIENPQESVICGRDDILMVRTGNTGMVVTDIIGVFHNNFFKVNYDQNIDKDFLVYHLWREEIQKLIMNYAGTTTIPDLKHGDFYKLPFSKPSKNEQELISKKIKAIDKKIDSEKSTLTKQTQLKRGLMQDLLTGKVEVAV